MFNVFCIILTTLIATIIGSSRPSTSPPSLVRSTAAAPIHQAKPPRNPTRPAHIGKSGLVHTHNVLCGQSRQHVGVPASFGCLAAAAAARRVVHVDPRLCIRCTLWSRSRVRLAWHQKGRNAGNGSGRRQHRPVSPGCRARSEGDDWCEWRGKRPGESRRSYLSCLLARKHQGGRESLKGAVHTV